MQLPSEDETAMRCVTGKTTECAAGQSSFGWLQVRKLWRIVCRREGGRRGDEGAVVMETALSTIILLTLCFGLMEICLALYSFHYVSEAAREGTRYAMVHGSTCVVGGVSCRATSGEIQSYVQDLGYPGIQATHMTVTTHWSAYPAGGTCAAVGCNGPGDLATVTAQYAFTLSIPFVTSRLLNLSSTSSMVISQ